jgi:tetratricopeptide (TPR) repeat protein
MKLGILCVTLMAFLLSALMFLPQNAPAREAKALVPDKALCAQMIRFGKESYQRGKFLDAKEYFRRAVQADPASPVAWRHYDLSVISALAEKVNKDTGLIAPDVSPQGPAQAKVVAPPPPTPKPAPAKKEKFVIVEDEGC